MNQNLFEETYTQFVRKREMEKVRWMDNISKVILPSHKKRVQQDDRTVMQEVVVPGWVTWEMLRSWAGSLPSQSEPTNACVICNENKTTGIQFKNKFICEPCFTSLKGL